MSLISEARHANKSQTKSDDVKPKILIKWETSDYEDPSVIADVEIEDFGYEHKSWMNESVNDSVLIECRFSDVEEKSSNMSYEDDTISMNDSQINSEILMHQNQTELNFQGDHGNSLDLDYHDEENSIPNNEGSMYLNSEQFDQKSTDSNCHYFPYDEKLQRHYQSDCDDQFYQIPIKNKYENDNSFKKPIVNQSKSFSNNEELIEAHCNLVITSPSIGGSDTFDGKHSPLVSQDFMVDESLSSGINTELHLIKVTNRLFITYTREIPEYSVHCRRLVQVKNKICRLLSNPQIFLLNTFDDDENLTRPFNKVLNCFFDLKKRPNLQHFVDFSETFYDWLALDRSHVILMHSAGQESATRLIVLLFCLTHYYATFGNSDISQVFVQSIYSISEETECEIPIVFLRFSSYMIKFSPGKKCFTNKATRKLHAIELRNCQLSSDTEPDYDFNVFYKFHYGSNMDQVHTTNVNYLAKNNDNLLLIFDRKPLTICGDILLIAYFYQKDPPKRTRICKILFNTVQETDDLIEFDRNSFDEVNENMQDNIKLYLYFSNSKLNEFNSSDKTSTCYETILPTNILSVDAIKRRSLASEINNDEDEERLEVLCRNSITDVRNPLLIDRYQCRMATLERPSDDESVKSVNQDLDLITDKLTPNYEDKIEEKALSVTESKRIMQNSFDSIYDTESVYDGHSLKKNVSFSTKNLITNQEDVKKKKRAEQKIKKFKKKFAKFVDKANVKLDKVRDILTQKELSNVKVVQEEINLPPKKTLRLDGRIFKNIIQKSFHESNFDHPYTRKYPISRIDECPIEEDRSDLNMATTSDTRDLDLLIDELQNTVVSISKGRPPAPVRSPINRYTARSTSATGNGSDNPWSYKHRQLSNTQNSSVYNTANTALNQASSTMTSNYENRFIPVRKTSADRHQSVFTTTIDNGSTNSIYSNGNKKIGSVSNLSVTPNGQRKYNEIFLTIDPKNGSFNDTQRLNKNSTSMNQISSFNTTRNYSSQNLNVTSDQMTEREQALLNELMNTKKELANLRSSQTVLNNIDQTDATIRNYSNFHRSYQSQTNLFSGSQNNRKFSGTNYNGIKNPGEGYTTNLNQMTKTINSSTYNPKRAMSSTNVNGAIGGRSWTIKDHQGSVLGRESDLSFMGDNFSTISGLTNGNKSGYSARRERLKHEQEAERLRQIQQKNLNTSSSRIRASSNALNASSASTRRLEQNSHYRSMNSMSSNINGGGGETFEEVETITLQPIGRGVQDLESNMGSTTTLARAANPKTASLLDGDQKNGIAKNQKESFGSGVFNKGILTNDRKDRSFRDFSRQNSGMPKYNDPMDSMITEQKSSSNMNQNSYQTTSRVNGADVSDLELASLTKSIWYRPKLSRDEAIKILRQLPPGSFLVRDSTTYENAYGLAVKVDTLPPKIQPKSGMPKFIQKVLNDMQSELVRHYLIEGVSSPEIGVRLKGFANEPVFPDLESLIYQHTKDSLALPCKLNLHNLQFTTQNDSNGYGDTMLFNNSKNGTMSRKNNFFSKLLSGSSSNHGTMNNNYHSYHEGGQSLSVKALLLGTVPVESLTGEAGLKRAVDYLMPQTQMNTAKVDSMGGGCRIKYIECLLQMKPGEGITITDKNRKLFFRRHLAASSIVWSGVEHRDKEFHHEEQRLCGIKKPKLFGFIQRKEGDNQCFLFTELDPDHNAKQIVTFINSHFT